MASRKFRTLLIVSAILAVVVLSAELDLFERFAVVALQYQALQLTEVFSVLMVAALWLPVQIWLDARRLRRSKERSTQIELQAQEATLLCQVTRLANRRRLLSAITARQTPEDLPPTVMLVTIAGFRGINENHGHEIADRVLVEIARRIERTCGKSDLPARLNAAEFAILLGPKRHRKSAERLSRTLMKEIAEPLEVGFRTLWVRANIGIATGPDRAEEDDALLCADRALSLAKKAGPGHYRIFDSEARSVVQREAKVRESLQRSLDRDEVEPVFQPIVNLKTHRIDGVEVLSRWPKCREGIPTFEYILAAERDGSIGLLTDLILAKACQTMSRLAPDIWMSFNLSAQQFVDPDLPERILSTLSLYGIETSRFIVEITETAVMEDLAIAEKVISTFRDAGVKIALDDFGTGASSLTLLARLPLDRIKIDRSFVGHVESSKSNAEIVTSMLVLAKGMGMSVVTEGIERPEEHDFLVAHGCPYGQGYLYGRPCPADKLPQRLAAGPDYLRLLDQVG